MGDEKDAVLVFGDALADARPRKVRMGIIEFIARVSAVEAMTGVRPGSAYLNDEDIASLQADIAKHGGVIQGCDHVPSLPHDATMRLASVYVYRQLNQLDGPVWG